MAEPARISGRTLGHYRVLEQIAAGGMGVVYRAHDQRLERDVAIKVLPPGVLADEAARKRFRKEALVISRLNHPNVATVYDFDSQDGIAFLVMELIPGSDIDQKVAAKLKKRYSCSYEVAIAYIFLGRRDTAFQFLEKGYRDRSDCMPMLGVDPRMEEIRSDPRYKELLRRLELAKYFSQ